MHQAKFIHIICTEPRIQKFYHDYLAKNDLFGDFDTIQYENPVLDFLDTAKMPAIIERLKLYIELHGARKIVVFDHFDCGAYKKAGYKFADFEQELSLHRENNKKAELVIERELLGMEVEFKYIKIKHGKAEWL